MFLLTTKYLLYNSVMEFGKVVQYFPVKRQRKEHTVHSHVAVLEHQAHPFLQHGFLLSRRRWAAEQVMLCRHQDHADHITRSEREGVNCNRS